MTHIRSEGHLPRRIASAIRTDTVGLIVEDMTVPFAGKRATRVGYRARRDAPGWQPLTLLLGERHAHEHARDVTRRLAKLGRDTIALDLYNGESDDADEDLLMALDATLAWAAAHQVDASRVAVVGFGAGGRLAWLYASHQPRLRAAVAWYAPLEGITSPAHPRHPLDIARSLRCPVLGLYGSLDDQIPMDSIERMRTALRAAGSASQILVMPDAGHGFFADDTARYARDAAEEAWQRLQMWLHQHGA